MLEADAQRIKDEEHLRTLGILNYVVSGLFVLVVLSGIPFMAMARSHRFAETFERARAEAAEDAMGRAWANGQDPLSGVTAANMETVMLVFFGIWMALAVVAVILSFLNGRYLRSYRHHTFSTIIAALQCLVIPLGTVLGVFTLIVLGRMTVRDSYAQARGEPSFLEDYDDD